MNEKLAYDPEKFIRQLLDDVLWYLYDRNLVKKVKINKNPVHIGSYYEMRMIADMLDRRRDVVGTIRATIEMADDGGYADVKVEWTKDLFGFWFREEFDPDFYEDGSGFDAEDEMEMVCGAIARTANRSSSLKSQLLMHSKTKKNESKDRSFESGLVAA